MIYSKCPNCQGKPIITSHWLKFPPDSANGGPCYRLICECGTVGVECESVDQMVDRWNAECEHVEKCYSIKI